MACLFSINLQTKVRKVGNLKKKTVSGETHDNVIQARIENLNIKTFF